MVSKLEWCWISPCFIWMRTKMTRLQLKNGWLWIGEFDSSHYISFGVVSANCLFIFVCWTHETHQQIDIVSCIRSGEYWKCDDHLYEYGNEICTTESQIVSQCVTYHSIASQFSMSQHDMSVISNGLNRVITQYSCLYVFKVNWVSHHLTFNQSTWADTRNYIESQWPPN